MEGEGKGKGRVEEGEDPLITLHTCHFTCPPDTHFPTASSGRPQGEKKVGVSWKNWRGGRKESSGEGEEWEEKRREEKGVGREEKEGVEKERSEKRRGGRRKEWVGREEKEGEEGGERSGKKS
ncbi:hypothetical protein Pcinc_030524 [Petrolisthes cinctipes]|uniref:Uncharacterized protein n=1 Tax=Petrolisthes cinctipes TaxID=88211 RepID=A0AAE1K673_PETCI|nr:hypothetical protein Pcinc_030524 [Petrolisthes cinctipes]